MKYTQRQRTLYLLNFMIPKMHFFKYPSRHQGPLEVVRFVVIQCSFKVSIVNFNLDGVPTFPNDGPMDTNCEDCYPRISLKKKNNLHYSLDLGYALWSLKTGLQNFFSYPEDMAGYNKSYVLVLGRKIIVECVINLQ